MISDVCVLLRGYFLLNHLLISLWKHQKELHGIILYGFRTMCPDFPSLSGWCVRSKNRLSTKDRLWKWGLVQDQWYPMYSRKYETLDHLFFECDYTYVWSRLQSFCSICRGVYVWREELQRWIQNSKQNCFSNQLRKALLGAAIYYFIWLERN
ncbi:hypothetical protein ACH5RR_032491 [Cinchona calisaya]|uniref:Reverse transcriptase zinc-binding domain-containing protein n=1 Tax=Cinchona calisaya TaxID=153742 RepID=A0ABD2YKS8_9GENT